MPEQKRYRCVKCEKFFHLIIKSIPHVNEYGQTICDACYHAHPGYEWVENKFNEPAHYHKYEIDTIDFLQKGFPPSVFIGFAVGSAIKYIHRYENKNGLEDLHKADDYIKRLIKFHEEKGLSK